MTTAALLDRLAPDDQATPDDQRSPARDWIEHHGFPTTRDELWHYSPVKELMEWLESATPTESSTETGVSRPTIDELAGSHGTNRLVFVNGVYAPQLSDVEPGEHLWCGTSNRLPAERLLALGGRARPTFSDGFQALNRATRADTALIVVDPDTTVADPLHVVHLRVPGGDRQVANPSTAIFVGDRANGHVIETYVALAGAGFTNADTTVELGESAELTHHRIQAEPLGSIHIGLTTVEQAAGSHLAATSVLVGADIARHALTVHQHGAHATSHLDGLYVPSRRQRHDLTITVDHAADNGVSRQRFTGVVDDHARASFSGKVVVRADTAGNDADQSNRNLLLRPTAQADTRPWLEIFADDVSCTHGATVGRLDQDALFYLRCRGIPFDIARTMLIDAFVDEITSTITPISLREHLAGVIADHRSGDGS